MNTRLLAFAILPGALFATTPATPVTAPASTPAPVAKPAAAPVAKSPAASAAKPEARRSLAQLGESKRALAAELVTLINVRKQFDAGAAEIRAGLDHQLNEGLKGPAASQKALVEQYRVKAHAIVNAGLDWNLMKADVAAAYADTFSEEELKGLLAFFSTPVGKAYAEKGTRISTQIGVITHKRMQEVQPRLQSNFYELDLRLRQALQSPAGAQAQPPAAAAG